MKVLSLFDGISGAQVALNNLGIIPELYVSSEINKHAIKVTQSRFPNTYQAGDVEFLDQSWVWNSSFDLVIFGSPCTDLSIAKKNRQSLHGKSSSLFYFAVNILNKIKPKYFLMENVASMTDESKDIISELLGVEPLRINSNHFIPQNRDRLYWTNIDYDIPNKSTEKRFEDYLIDKNVLSGVLQFKYSLSQKALDYMNRTVKGGRNHWDFGHHSDTNNKNCACITSNFKKGVPYNVLIDRRNGTPWVRSFAPLELERLQGFPSGYTEGIAKTHRFECLGNSFTIPVIEQLLLNLNE